MQYSIIFLSYPEQKYFTHFCVLSNCRCMGHLYNPHMKIREKEMFRLCSKSPLTSLFCREKIRVQVSHVLDSDSDCTDIPDSKRQQLFHTDSELGDSFFCWKLDLVLFPSQLDSPSNSSGALSYERNNLTLQQNPSQTTSPKVLHHLHLGP